MTKAGSTQQAVTALEQPHPVLWGPFYGALPENGAFFVLVNPSLKGSWNTAEHPQEGFCKPTHNTLQLRLH